MRNVLNCFPKRLQGEVKTRLREIYYASSKEQSVKLMRAFAESYGNDYPRAVECLLKDQDQLLTYFSYPQAHWQSLKTTNPIESIFAPVKLRTNAARRIKSPRSALYLIYALIIRAQKRWRKINAPELVNDVIQRIKFENGIKVITKTKKQRKMS
jgi:transposase-like protein